MSVLHLQTVEGTPKGVALGEAAPQPPSVAFLFPGQGAQRLGMLSDARVRFPIVADTLTKLDEALTCCLGWL